MEKMGNMEKPDWRFRAIVQMTKDGEFIKEFRSLKEAEAELNIPQSHISLACSGRRQTAGGFRWAYKEKYTMNIINNSLNNYNKAINDFYLMKDDLMHNINDIIDLYESEMSERNRIKAIKDLLLDYDDKVDLIGINNIYLILKKLNNLKVD